MQVRCCSCQGLAWRMTTGGTVRVSTGGLSEQVQHLSIPTISGDPKRHNASLCGAEKAAVSLQGGWEISTHGSTPPGGWEFLVVIIQISGVGRRGWCLAQWSRGMVQVGV